MHDLRRGCPRLHSDRRVERQTVRWLHVRRPEPAGGMALLLGGRMPDARTAVMSRIEFVPIIDHRQTENGDKLIKI